MTFCGGRSEDSMRYVATVSGQSPSPFLTQQNSVNTHLDYRGVPLFVPCR